ncbi:30S ribosomal protein S9, mitochondrial [Amaranthus tricolor]|uniref:30S ribosomal protein S9, mitochondrial n=1 Tax=Amaranthus tricolor TaxID=29722 RepID=UPI00258F5FD6|nr:30S ribosomal protein S9, mitochondrial [Amaranthus tricolor]
MLGRFIATYSRHFRHFSTSLFPPPPPPFPPIRSSQIPKIHSTHFVARYLSTSNNGNNNNENNSNSDSNFWNISQENDGVDAVFGIRDENLTGTKNEVGKVSGTKTWKFTENENVRSEGVFEDFGVEESSDFSPTPDFEPWQFNEDDKSVDMFGIIGAVGEGTSDVIEKEDEMVNAAKKLELEKEEKALLEVLNGPNRAFGDLVAASGITDEMLDSLIALKNFEDIDGLPPLSQIEDEHYEKTLRKSTRYEMELQKQEEAAKLRVRVVDEKGRAYGTGKRKCSIARVWIQPGEGNFLINDKQFDVYFPMLDHRASLLRPFSETNTVGLWDVKCTVKGGGVTGQVEAIRLGISRALQCWEPGLRPPLREAGFLTRDPRVVERKKPGKAKARKSFQWVKR